MLNQMELPLPVFDLDAVLELVDGEIELLQEIAEMFQSDLPSNMEQVRNALTAGNTEVVHQVTHRLKSTVGNLGGRAAHKAVQDLEKSARDGQTENTDELFANFQHELTHFSDTLAEFLAS